MQPAEQAASPEQYFPPSCEEVLESVLLFKLQPAPNASGDAKPLNDLEEAEGSFATAEEHEVGLLASRDEESLLPRFKYHILLSMPPHLGLNQISLALDRRDGSPRLYHGESDQLVDPDQAELVLGIVASARPTRDTHYLYYDA